MSANAVSGTNTLYAGEQLLRGQSLYSNNGLYQLILQDDGNLVLYKSSKALWASGTDGKAVKNCIMQTDGNLVLYAYNGIAVWASNTNGTGDSSSRLVMQDDGNLVMYKNGAVWASNTWYEGLSNTNDPNNKDYLKPNEQLIRGQSIKSDNGLFTLIQQDDGNLVLYGFNKALWASGTDGKAVKNCIMQSDGNLVLYGYNGSAVWSSGTYNHPNPILRMQNDGNVVIYANTAFWATGTNN
jgi:pseudomonalisin